MNERLNIRRMRAVEKTAHHAPFDAAEDISESEITRIGKRYGAYLQKMAWKEVAKLASELRILRPNKMLLLNASHATALRRQLQQLKASGSLENYLEFAANLHNAFPTLKLDIPREDIRNYIAGLEIGRNKFKMAYYFKISLSGG
jgi:hypothetical protein